MQLNISKTELSVHSQSKLNEWLCSIYLYLFTILSGIIAMMPRLSFLILLFSFVFLLVISIAGNRIQFQNYRSLVLYVFLFLTVIVLDIVFRNNTLAFNISIILLFLALVVLIFLRNHLTWIYYLGAMPN